MNSLGSVGLFQLTGRGAGKDSSAKRKTTYNVVTSSNTLDDLGQQHRRQEEKKKKRKEGDATKEKTGGKTWGEVLYDR